MMEWIGSEEVRRAVGGAVLEMRQHGCICYSVSTVSLALLHSVLPSMVIQRAVEIVEAGNVTKVLCRGTGRCLYTVKGHKTYVVLPGASYCPCKYYEGTLRSGESLTVIHM